ELVCLALDEQRALIESDYEAILRLSTEQTVVADRIDQLDTVREALVTELDHGDTLQQIRTLADSLGMDGFEAMRERLYVRALELRQAQEMNAQLILNAVKLKERWYAMLAGMASSTYGAAGKQELRPSRGIVSRSA